MAFQAFQTFDVIEYVSLPYHAKIGTFDPAQEPHEHREFYFEPVLVTTANAQEIKNQF